MQDKPLVSINIVVLNGQKYVPFCLDSILEQKYPHGLIEVNILDNGSQDKTLDIIQEKGKIIQESGFNKFELIRSDKNLGMWPGQEELLKSSSGKYVLAMAIDIILDKDFISNSISILESDSKIGAIQSKTYKFDIEDDQPIKSDALDTCGFEIYRSRRIINIGHGKKDQGEFTNQKEIFAVEGACPIFRKEALLDIKINNQLVDPGYFWYGDDLDLAWRMNILGWKQIFCPEVIAWHDRQTTKRLGNSTLDFIKMRREIPIKKRALDWRNVRFTIIKNDYIINLLKDLPRIVIREVGLFLYLLIFETKVAMEIFSIISHSPKLLRDRREIMRKSKVSAKDFRSWLK